MKSIFIILFILINISHTGIDCGQVKTGSFKLVSEESGTTIIIRTTDEQIETNEYLNVRVKYNIHWLDECTYQLFDAEILSGDTSFKGSQTDTLTVKITEVTNSYYTAQLSSNFADFISEAKIEISN
ncbi:MAG: hypothetical protein QM503_05565 [Bacteroidota bacterium]